MRSDKPEHSKRDADRVEWIRSVMDRHEGPLLRYTARILGGDLERGRDVVQDAFLKLWKSDRFGVDDNVAQWLFAVCRNGAVDVLRKEKRMIGLSDEIKRNKAASGSGRCSSAASHTAPTRLAEPQCSRTGSPACSRRSSRTASKTSSVSSAGAPKAGLA